jgi:hypothetical protein
MTANTPAHNPEITVEHFELTLRLDATVTVFDGAGQATDWLKPGAETKVRWRGGVPSEAEIRLGYQHMQHTVLAPMVEEIVVQLRARLDETRRGR